MSKRFLFLTGDCGSVSERDRRNSRRYVASLIVWALSYLACTYLIAGETVTGGAAGWTIALLPSLTAAVAVGFFIRYLWNADEMQRLIELQALALAVFVGFITWPGLNLLKEMGVAVDDISEFQPMVMIMAYVAGTVLSRRQFR